MNKIKLSLYIIGLLIMFNSYTYGAVWDGICPVCKEKGIKSTVKNESNSNPYITLAIYIEKPSPYYDENGKYVDPSIDETLIDKKRYSCSKGHVFEITIEKVTKINVLSSTKSNQKG